MSLRRRSPRLALCAVALALVAVACTPADAKKVQAAMNRFNLLSATATLPDGATCASKVKAASEVRAGNVTANHTKGTQKNLTQPYPIFSRVDGNFTGTTDEIIQWAACKWGLDEDLARAQVAVESYWDQNSIGDWQGDSTACVPGHGIGADGRAGVCPASGGLMSITYRYYSNAFPEAMTSSAYNLDYAFAWFRACYTGQITWLNSVERGQNYAAGDAWGCIGTWFSGRWHTAASEQYVQTVQSYMAQKTWTTATFIARG